MSLAHVISNTVRVVTEAGFREQTDYRRPLEEQPIGGSDRRFHAIVPTAEEVLARHAISDNVRTAALLVRVSHFRGGGDAGGARAGGSYYDVNARAGDDALALAANLEDHLTYDAQNTGIRRVVMGEVTRSFDGPLSEVWDLPMAVEFEAFEDARAVA